MSQAFNDLVNVVARLRSPQGCPWDLQQTHESLKPYLLEETYEVLDALDQNDPRHLREELGDLLLQILLHARIESEQNTFDVEDVIKDVTQKLIRRHPHVFTDEPSPRLDPDQVRRQWDTIKRAERSAKPGRDSVLDGVPPALPALLRAYQMQKRASRVGFDWETGEQVVEKMHEEFDELRMETTRAHHAPEPNAAAPGTDTQAAVEREVGDVLFTMVNVARFLSINPEEALRKATTRFQSRFQRMERQAAHDGRPLHGMTALEWDALWNAAKEQEQVETPSPPAPRSDQDHA